MIGNDWLWTCASSMPKGGISYWIFLMTNGSRNTFEVELTLLVLILHQLPMPDETLPQTVAWVLFFFSKREGYVYEWDEGYSWTSKNNLRRSDLLYPLTESKSDASHDDQTQPLNGSGANLEDDAQPSRKAVKDTTFGSLEMRKIGSSPLSSSLRWIFVEK